MKHGDLIYIPQDVLLYGASVRFRTDKPTTALFLEESEQHFTYNILVDGKRMSVRKNHVYALKEHNVGEVNRSL